MKFKCPVNYDLENCSSKEYGLTCETCFHMEDTEIFTPSELKAIHYDLKEAKLIRQGKMKKRTWDELVEENKN